MCAYLMKPRPMPSVSWMPRVWWSIRRSKSCGRILMSLGPCKLAQLGKKAQIWVTETGFSTWRGDERSQVRAFVDALDAPAERIYWQEVHDRKNAACPAATVAESIAKGCAGLFGCWSSSAIGSRTGSTRARETSGC